MQRSANFTAVDMSPAWKRIGYAVLSLAWFGVLFV